jgi:hypothetical protein
MSQQRSRHVEVYANNEGRFVASPDPDTRITLANLDSRQIQAVVTFLEARAVDMELDLGRAAAISDGPPDRLKAGGVQALRLTQTKFEEYLTTYRINMTNGEI